MKHGDAYVVMKIKGLPTNKTNAPFRLAEPGTPSSSGDGLGFKGLETPRNLRPRLGLPGRSTVWKSLHRQQPAALPVCAARWADSISAKETPSLLQETLCGSVDVGAF